MTLFCCVHVCSAMILSCGYIFEFYCLIFGFKFRKKSRILVNKTGRKISFTYILFRLADTRVNFLFEQSMLAFLVRLRPQKCNWIRQTISRIFSYHFLSSRSSLFHLSLNLKNQVLYQKFGYEY